MISVTKNGKKNHDERLIDSRRLHKGRGKIQKEFALDRLRNFMVDEAEVMLRIPTMFYAVEYVLNAIESSEEVMRHFHPKTGRENPVRACLMVGSLSRRDMGHIDHYVNLVENIEEISAEDYDKNLQIIAERNNDIDLCFIGKNTSAPLSIVGRKLLKMLPDMRIGNFQGYEIHGDCSIREREFNDLNKFYNRDSNYEMDVHKLEILEKNENKEKVPVELWRNNKLDSKIKEVFDEYIENGWLRKTDKYLKETFAPYQEAFRRKFPEDYERITTEASKELKEFQDKNWVQYLRELDY